MLHCYYDPVCQAWLTAFGPESRPSGLGDANLSRFSSLEELDAELATLGLRRLEREGVSYRIISRTQP